MHLHLRLAALLCTISLAACHGGPLLGPCSYGALNSGIDAVDASSDTPASKAGNLERYGGKMVACGLQPTSFFTLDARALLRAGFDREKAHGQKAAFKDFTDAATMVQNIADDQTADSQVRSDASDVLKQTNDALAAWPTK